MPTNGKAAATNFNPLFASATVGHAIWKGWVNTAVAAVGATNAPDKQRLLELAMDHITSSADPKNSPFNPAVTEEAVATGGASLLKGMTQMYRDMTTNNGMPSVSDNSGYAVGVNIGTTPYEVVLKTPLLQLRRYLPTTKTVYEVPLLIVTPLINGPEIADLQPGQSFVESMVNSSHVTYKICWTNADASMADVSLEDYIIAVVDAIEFIGTRKVNVFGICMGGDIMFKSIAYMGATGSDVINTHAAAVSLPDYPKGGTGAIGAMVDEQLYKYLEQKIAKNGVMLGDDIAAGMGILLPDALVYGAMFKYWWMGKDLPRSPLMAWNALTKKDIAGRAYLEYIQECYLKNSFAQGTFEVRGVPVNRRHATAPRFLVVGSTDHIVNRDTALAGGSVADDDVEIELVEAEAGHVGTLAVKATSPKANYRTCSGPFTTRAAFDAQAVQHRGSWYTAYAAFLAGRSGELVSTESVFGPMGEDDFILVG